jgi:hypothetical protein
MIVTLRSAPRPPSKLCQLEGSVCRSVTCVWGASTGALSPLSHSTAVLSCQSWPCQHVRSRHHSSQATPRPAPSIASTGMHVVSHLRCARCRRTRLTSDPVTSLHFDKTTAKLSRYHIDHTPQTLILAAVTFHCLIPDSGRVIAQRQRLMTCASRVRSTALKPNAGLQSQTDSLLTVL